MPEIKFKLTATIPVIQYGNIQPSIELQGEEYDRLEQEAMGYVKKLWDKYGEKPFPTQERGEWVRYISFTGEEIYYNDEIHRYKDARGNFLVSGSEYARKHQKEFNKEIISKQCEKKYQIPADTIVDMWEKNSKISTTFGSAIHYVMEQWFTHRSNGTEKEWHLPKHPFLKKAIELFPLKDEQVNPEVLISDVENGMVGRIDGLVIHGDKEGVIIDYKTDAKVEDNLEHHALQLNFYRKILENKGWKITGLEIWNYLEDWKSYQIEIK